jgi:hypothetical protein
MTTTILNPFSACDQGNAAGKALVTSAPVPRHTAQAPDLDALAAMVRDAHHAVELAVSDMLEHAFRAGHALNLAKTQVPKGRWGQWRDEHTGVKERTDRVYRELAANRAELESYRQSVDDLSIAAALRILGTLRTGRALPVAAARRSKPKLDVPAVIAWWNDASLEDRRCFLDSAGRRAIDDARPPSWRHSDDIGASSTGEIARLKSRIEELQREVRQRDLTIAGLRRELGMPVDDGLDIPTFLRRLPPPDALESIEAEAEVRATAIASMRPI